MTISKTVTLTAISLLFAASAASAQSASVDVNGDGFYSLPEVQGAMPDMTQDDFLVLDANGDGLLDAAEIEAATQAGLLATPEG
jgi:hypothetical protein